jgi:hypothetical protein
MARLRRGLQALALPRVAIHLGRFGSLRVGSRRNSRADFAKVMEVFDRYGMSFSAVTQQINSATSMGCLMLKPGESQAVLMSARSQTHFLGPGFARPSLDGQAASTYR